MEVVTASAGCEMHGKVIMNLIDGNRIKEVPLDLSECLDIDFITEDGQKISVDTKQDGDGWVFRIDAENQLVIYPRASNMVYLQDKR